MQCPPQLGRTIGGCTSLRALRGHLVQGHCGGDLFAFTSLCERESGPVASPLCPPDCGGKGLRCLRELDPSLLLRRVPHITAQSHVRADVHGHHALARPRRCVRGTGLSPELPLEAAVCGLRSIVRLVAAGCSPRSKAQLLHVPTRGYSTVSGRRADPDGPRFWLRTDRLEIPTQHLPEQLFSAHDSVSLRFRPHRYTRQGIVHPHCR